MWKAVFSNPIRPCVQPSCPAVLPSFFLTVLIHTMGDSKSRRCSSEETPRENLKKNMSEWQFSPSLVLKYGLPIDPEKENFIRPNVKGAIYSRVEPTPLVKNVKLVAYSKDVLINILNMDPSITETQDFIDWIAGSKVLDSSTPLAHRYGGHQFGSWVTQLGDGRAISLGEYVSHDGKRWEVQVKGSGLTPYSRGGDGRAVLRSSIREFLCSEAMHALGIPTSRAAALVVSNDPVIRDQFYDGRPELERAAVLMRIAPSFLRFGSLEVLTRNNEMSELKKLLDFILMQRTEITDCGEQKYLALLEQVINESIKLVVAWQTVGFTHGVLNTDNMSLFGVTIDYGPFGFLETCDQGFIPNSSDTEGRYSFSEQIKVLQWNLEKLVMAIRPLLVEPERRKAEVLLQNVVAAADAQLSVAFHQKLGFKENPNLNSQLSSLFLKIMEDTSSDFTMTFRQLGFVSIDEMSDSKVLEKHWALKLLKDHKKFYDFLHLYRLCMNEEGLTDEERRSNILAKNPQYVLRNWMAQEAIKQAEQDDFSGVNFLLDVLNSPFTINEEAERKGFSGPTPPWAYCIRVSCSS